MQLHLPTHLENRGLYTNTEYDDIRLGEWRVVWSYCPRRHRYVRDLAAPILAAQGIAADDPDAAIAPEPEKHPLSELAHVRRQHRVGKIVAAIVQAGAPIALADACEVLHCQEHSIRHLLEHSDDIQHVGYKSGRAYVGLAHHTAADIPMSEREMQMLAVMRELGEGTAHDIAAGMGWVDVGPLGRYKHMLDHRNERFDNGRQVYTRRVYRLKPEYAV